MRTSARSPIACTLLLALCLPQVAFAQAAADKGAKDKAPASAPAAAAPAAAAPAAPAAAAPAAAEAVPAPSEPAKPLAESLTGEALAEYESASLLYRDGDYAGAVTKFNHTYELANDPRLLWNIAVCEKNLRHYAQVHRLVTRYLAEGGALLTAEDRASAEALLSAIQSFVSSLNVSVKPDGADVLVDGKVVGKSPLPEALNIDMGSHIIGAQLEGYVEQKRTIELVGGRGTDVVFELQEVRHIGTLRVVAGPRQEIYVDGKVVGVGQWEGELPSGTHRVRVTAEEKKPFESDVKVTDQQVSSINVSLSDVDKQSGGPMWPWLLGGGAVAAGLGVGAYFLFRPQEAENNATVGTIPPGQINL